MRGAGMRGRGMRWLRMRGLAAAAFVAVLALVPVAAPAWSGTDVACAATGGSHAGLVIDTGSRVLEYCVALDASSVSGLHLIELAHAQYGLAYGFGLGGQAVCRLGGVGPAGDDCFADYPDYWGYWHGDGHGGWNWASTGAGEASVGDGDLDAWTWGGGDSGTTHPTPPTATIDHVCPPSTPAPEPNATPATTGPTASKAPPSPVVGKTSTATHTRTPAPARPEPTGTRTPPATLTPSTATPSAATRAAVAAPPRPGGGPPTGLLAAVALAGLLGAGGWLRSRSRSRSPA